MLISMAATAASNTEPPSQTLFSSFSMTPIIVLLIFMVGMWYVSSRSQKKREKEAADLKKNLEIGDEVTTIGGVVGIVVNIKDDVFTLETGGDRAKIRFTKWAIQTNSTAKERAAVEKTNEKKK